MQYMYPQNYEKFLMLELFDSQECFEAALDLLKRTSAPASSRNINSMFEANAAHKVAILPCTEDHVWPICIMLIIDCLKV